MSNVVQPRPLLAAAWQRRCDTPDDLALSVYREFLNPEELTWAQLFDEAGDRAARLARQVPKGTVVFLMEPDVREVVLWWIAAVSIGAVPGILTPPTSKVSEDRHKTLMAAMASGYPDAVLLVSPHLADDAWADEDRVLVTDQLDEAGKRPDFTALVDTQAEVSNQPMLFQQSSGTTGLRKGMLMSEQAVCGHLMDYGTALDVQDDDIWLSWLPLYHDMGLVGVFLNALYHGRPQILCSPMLWLAHPAWLLNATQVYQATLMWLPNFAFQLMGDRPLTDPLGPDTLRSVRMVISCSEPVLATSTEMFSQRMEPVGLPEHTMGASYAMAETVFAATQTPPGTDLVIEQVDPVALDRDRVAVLTPEGRSVVSSGRALKDVEILICDPDGKPLPDGKVGQIRIKSPHRMTSYCGIGADRDPFDEAGTYISGDYGYMRGGELFVLGREDDLIIRAGRNLDPAVIEAEVSGLDGVKGGRVACFGIPNPQEGTMDVVILAEADGTQKAEEDVVAAIVRACQRSFDLAANDVRAVPSGFVVKSSSGKVARAATRKKYLEEFGAA